MSIPPVPLALDDTRMAGLFPFFIQTDPGLSVARLGPSVARLFPDLRPGGNLGKSFQVLRPTVANSADKFPSLQGELFILRHQGTGLLLRGQFLVAGEGVWFFLLTPWIDDVEQLPRLGLSLRDFALHDPMMDLLHLGQSHRRTMNEVRALNTKLEGQQAALEAANLRLEHQVAALNESERRLRASESQARALADEAQAASEAKSRFVANMTHELRTPLNVVLATLDLMQMGGRSLAPAAQAEHIVRAQESGRHLLELINQVLEITRAEKGQGALDLAPVNLRVLVDACVDQVRPLAAAKQIQPRISFEAQTIHMAADGLKLRQIVRKLLTNAVKFTPERGTVALTVDESADGSSITFLVEDSGCGIPAADQARLFKPFEQVDMSMTREVGGAGLGLVLVRHYARLHGGDVAVASEPGRGSRFIVTLPLRHVEMAAKAPGERGGEARPLGDVEVIPANHRILVAEDFAPNRIVLEGFLEIEGFEIESAENGEEVIEKARARPPSLIFMDIAMPRVDGLEATRILRSDPRTKDIPVLALTAFANPSVEAQCRAAGVDAYLTKPVDFEAVRATVHRLLARR